MIALLSIILLVCGIVYFIMPKMVQQIIPKNKIVDRLVVFILILSIFGIFKPFEIIPSGSKGLMFTWGKINDKEISPGLAFKIPMVQAIEKITTRPIQLDYKIDVGAGGAITKDNQTIGATMTIFYKYKEGELVKMWGKFGKDKIESILISSEVESFKAVVGLHAIFDIPLSQDSIRLLTILHIRDKMNIYPVEVTELKITNYDWSDEFDKQIQETMHRAQQVKQKQQELLITEQEAQKKVKEAEADKTALITKAEGEKASAILLADAKAAEGEGIKKYNQSVQANMELELKLRSLEIEKIKAEKWNGAYVPVNNYGPIPISSNSGLLPKN